MRKSWNYYNRNKKSVSLSERTLSELKEESVRLERSLSWLINRAWKLARTEIQRIPSVPKSETDLAESRER